jgi:hypothetical protein
MTPQQPLPLCKQFKMGKKWMSEATLKIPLLLHPILKIQYQEKFL